MRGKFAVIRYMIFLGCPRTGSNPASQTGALHVEGMP